MGIKETLLAKFEGEKKSVKRFEKEAQSYVPREIRQPIERKIESFKEHREESSRQKEILQKIQSHARFEKEKELARTRGIERAEKGSMPRQIGTAVLRKLKAEATARNKGEGKRMIGATRKFLEPREIRTSPTTTIIEPMFAPASFSRPPEKESRPFLIGGDTRAEKGAGLSMGMSEAFFDTQKQRQAMPQRQPTAIDRAFFGTPSLPSVGMSAPGQRVKAMPRQAMPQRQPTAIDRAFYGEQSFPSIGMAMTGPRARPSARRTIGRRRRR